MSANSKTGGTPIFYCPICPMLAGWLLVQERDAHMAEKHPEQPTVTGSGLVELPPPQPVRATRVEREQFRAENAEMAQVLEQIIPFIDDSFPGKIRQARAALAKARGNA